MGPGLGYFRFLFGGTGDGVDLLCGLTGTLFLLAIIWTFKFKNRFHPAYLYRTNGFGYVCRNPYIMGWQSHKDKSVRELITLCQARNGNDSDEALQCLVFQLRGRLIKRCEKFSKARKLDNEIAIQMTELAFVRYGKSRNFDLEKCKGECITTCIIVYLCKIAVNEHRRLYQKKQREKEGKSYDGSEKIIYELPKSNSRYESSSIKIVRQVLSRFSKAHQAIYLTYGTYEHDGRKLPRKLLLQLRTEFQLEQNTVRTYKKEVKDSVQLALQVLKMANDE